MSCKHQNRATLCVMISGRGSNLKALIDACDEPDFPAEIKLVISDNRDAGGLQLARAANIPSRVFARGDYPSKNAHEEAILQTLGEFRPELICLAGYMRILSAEFVGRYPDQILNIHPSLLPRYPGLDTHQRALEAGDKQHGCTVHFVDQGMDTGPIIAQESIDIRENDNAASLAARVLEVEHRLYPRAVRTVLCRSP